MNSARVTCNINSNKHMNSNSNKHVNSLSLYVLLFLQTQKKQAGATITPTVAGKAQHGRGVAAPPAAVQKVQHRKVMKRQALCVSYFMFCLKICVYFCCCCCCCCCCCSHFENMLIYIYIYIRNGDEAAGFVGLLLFFFSWLFLVSKKIQQKTQTLCMNSEHSRSSCCCSPSMFFWVRGYSRLSIINLLFSSHVLSNSGL